MVTSWLQLPSTPVYVPEVGDEGHGVVHYTCFERLVYRWYRWGALGRQLRLANHSYMHSIRTAAFRYMKLSQPVAGPGRVLGVLERVGEWRAEERNRREAGWAESSSPPLPPPLIPAYRVSLFNRHDTVKRRWVNDDELVPLIHPRHSLRRFHSFSNLSAQQQAALHSETDVLIEAHGANSVNVLFLPPNATALMLAFVDKFDYQGVGSTTEYIPGVLQGMGIAQYTMQTPMLYNPSTLVNTDWNTGNSLHLHASPHVILQQLRLIGIELTV